MKKVLCVLMCAVLLLAMPMTVFAADTPYSGQGSSTITYKSYSTCTVSIPETIEITGAPIVDTADEHFIDLDKFTTPTEATEGV